MKSQEIRRQFLQYFKQQQHTIVPSSPVIPHDDPTLLFNNAGMNQFKDVFLGESNRDYKRVATSQKCIRAGGKHNDLENVGHTTRHLTFFEMLGNFSFGDYFKEQAIKFAWEVSTQIFGFDPDRIWPTIFRTDEEAFELWTRYVPADRITRFDEKDNFWAMGDTGPCGPCSELFFDKGPKYGNATRPSEDLEGNRFLEFWNLVFMQYNRSSPTVITPLPMPSIDTGAGLERIVSLKMGVDSVFETDILRSIIARVEDVSGIKYDLSNTERSAPFRVIADHLRCLSFAIADGAQPSNVDRGYVLRKILRRAVRYGRILGFEEPFLAKILPRLVETMGDDYQELKKSQAIIAEILTVEEESFLRTLRRGGNLLNQIIETAETHKKIISGDDAFKLKDTYGLPIDEIELLAKDANLTVDFTRFQALEKEAKERSKNAQKTTQQVASQNLFKDFVEKEGDTDFLGYTAHTTIGLIKALVVNGEFVNALKEGQEGIVILNKTPFYAEMGGQIGDTGALKSDHALFQVNSCQAPFKGLIAHLGKLEKGQLNLGDKVTATIDSDRRQKIENNHTATHLLHWALHNVLGEHIKQAGSVVDATRLRFDFNHHKALSEEEIHRIEDLVNKKIRENIPVQWYEISYDEAQKRSEIKQFFGEKYQSMVRVIDIDFSKELCGGTHTTRLGNIGLFRIAKESSIAAGVRRVEAVTGEDAEALHRQSESQLSHLATLLKTQPHLLSERTEKLVEENKHLAQELKGAQKAQLDNLVETLVKKAEKINDISLITAKVDLTPEELRSCAESILTKVSSGVIVLGASLPDKGHLFSRISDDLVNKGIKANDLIKVLAPIIDGSGGGKPNNAQAGGKAPEKVGEALLFCKKWLERCIGLH